MAKSLNYTKHYTESQTDRLNLCLIHVEPDSSNNETKHRDRAPVLFIHGATFPTMLASGFEMGGTSWLKYLSSEGFDVWALDFLGYGCSDRYPEMQTSSAHGEQLGKAPSAAADIEAAVAYIQNHTAAKRVSLVSHSRGGIVAGLYASQYPENIEKLVFFAPLIERQNSLTDSVVRFFNIGRPDKVAYRDLDVSERLASFENDVPQGKSSVLASEMATAWPRLWLASDGSYEGALQPQPATGSVRAPAGYEDDFYNSWTGHGYVDFSKILSPTLIIRGSWDSITAAKDTAHMMKRLTATPFKKLVTIADATHVAHLEQGRFQLYSATADFLKKH